MSVLESIGAAMPGVGYRRSAALIAIGRDPRATFLVAGLGVLAIVASPPRCLGTNWPERRAKDRSRAALTPKTTLWWS